MRGDGNDLIDGNVDNTCYPFVVSILAGLFEDDTSLCEQGGKDDVVRGRGSLIFLRVVRTASLSPSLPLSCSSPAIL